MGSLFYDIRSPDSNGGGHVQTANKGGTGQTTYTKGDLLVATSSSVIAKLAVSSVSGDVLVADVNQTAGMKWAPVVANKVVTNPTSVVLAGGAASVATVMFSASILGSTLGTNNGVKFTGVLNKFSSSQNFDLIVNYGNNVVSSVTIVANVGSILLGAGTIEGMIIGRGAVDSQLGYVKFHVTNPRSGVAATLGANIAVAFGAGNGTASVESSANQNLVITGVFPTVANENSVLAGFFVVEKIV